MSWHSYGISVRGSSHKFFNEPCQDAFIAEEINFYERSFFIGIASDGAGSAVLGKVGAEIACQSGFNILKQTILDTNYLESIDHNKISSIVREIRDYISIAALYEGYSLRDFACTFVGVVIGDDKAVFFQIGDGGIVIKEGNDYRVIFWPFEGIYVNMTNFITDENFQDFLKISIFDNFFEGVTLFTDGLQRQILDLKKREAYPRFFNYMFELFAKHNDKSIINEFHLILDGTDINKRTDDDRTFIIATRN